LVFEPRPGQRELFAETVIPLLQQRGLFHLDDVGETFRKRLGTPFSTNRSKSVRGAQSAA
jgi:hypothetical protein